MRQAIRQHTLVALLLALGLFATACGGGDSTDTTAAVSAGTTTTAAMAESTTTEAMAAPTTEAMTETTAEACDIDITFVGATSTQSFSIEQGMGAEQAGAAYGVNVKVLAPVDPGDFAGQVQLFNDAILDQPDGIVLFTLAPDQFVRPLADADSAGIAVIAADVPLEGYPTVTNDNVGMGSRLAEYVMRNVPADASGSVVLGITNPGLPVLELRAQGITEWVQANRPGLEVLGPFETTTDPTRNTQIWTDLVASNPDAVAFFGMGDQDSPSLAQIRRANPGATWANAGFDLNDTALEAIQQGDLDAVGDPQHFLKGYVGVALLVEHLCNGADLPRPAMEELLITLDNVVNVDNVDGIIARQVSPEARLDWYSDQIAEILTNPILVQP